MATKLSPPTPGGPRWDDARNREAGRWAKATGSRQNAARQKGHTPQRESQVRGGCPTGAEQRFYAAIDGLMRSHRTDGYPLIAGAHVVAEDALASAGLDLAEELCRAFARRAEAEGRITTLALRTVVRPGDEDAAIRFIAESRPHLEESASATLRVLGIERVLLRRM